MTNVSRTGAKKASNTQRSPLKASPAVVVQGAPSSSSGDTARPYSDPGVLTQLAALKTATTPELKGQWRELFESEPPPYNRRFLQSRLAYRIQELAFGGLKPETVEHLEALGEGLEAGKRAGGRIRGEERPIAGTRLIREWQGVEHCVTVCDEGYEYAGRPYASLSAVARAITGTRWNGWTFFGLKNHRAPQASASRAAQERARP